MLAFWWPATWRRQHYRVVVRPTLQGEFLVFPYAWRRHGKGYVLSRSLKNRLEAPDWRWWDGLALAACLGGCFLAFVLGWIVFPLLAGGFALWARHLGRRYDARVAEVLPRGRFAGVVLTRSRYELEYASQLSASDVRITLFFLYAATIAAVTAAAVATSRGAWNLTGSMLLLLVLLQWLLRRQHRLMAARHKAFRFSVKAGDPVDIALPVSGEETGEE